MTTIPPRDDENSTNLHKIVIIDLLMHAEGQCGGTKRVTAWCTYRHTPHHQVRIPMRNRVYRTFVVPNPLLVRILEDDAPDDLEKLLGSLVFEDPAAS